MEKEKTKLLILGAGQYGHLSKETAFETGEFDIVDFLDDANENAVGKLLDYEKIVGEYPQAFVAIGNADLRLELLCKLKDAGFRLATIISPRAYVSPSASVMEGTLVEPMAVVHTGCQIMEGVFVCAGAIINHNAVVERGCQIDCGAVVGSNAKVPEKTKVVYNEIFTKEQIKERKNV